MSAYRPAPVVGPFSWPLWVQKLIARIAFASSGIFCVTIAVALLNTACPAAKTVINDIDAVVQVVKNDLEAGVSDAQMAADVCHALGGSSTTDSVCAAVAFVIQDAVMILVDTGALSPAALERAKSYQASHPMVSR